VGPVPVGQLPVPKLSQAGEIEGCHGYALIELRFLGGEGLSLLTPEDGDRCVQWLSNTQEPRCGYFLELLRQLGAPTRGLPGHPETLGPLAEWFDLWSIEAFAAWQGLEPDDDLHGMYRPAHVLFRALRSLGLDLAFLVSASSTAAKTELHWGLVRRRWEDRTSIVAPSHYYSPTLLPADRSIDLIIQTEEFVRLSLRPFVREPGDELREWSKVNHKRALRHLYDCLVSGGPLIGPRSPGWVPPPKFERSSPRRKAVPVSDEVVVAVAAYREAGWFAKHAQASDAGLAAGLGSTWWRVHESELADLADGTLLDHRLIQLDSDRTLVTDIELDTSEGEDVYVRMLHQLGKLSGGSFKPLGVSENWEALPDRVVVGFGHAGQHLDVVVKECGDYIDPFVITQLNELLGPGPRFWFVDTGGQEAIVTCATAAEREHLQRLRPVHLAAEPPGWWSAVRDI
jgi:hypothetical protein